jgi:hypothetical protein
MCMTGRSYVLVLGLLLVISVFVTGCNGSASSRTTNIAPDGTDCSDHITAQQSKDLVAQANKYIEITNLCFGRDTAAYNYNNELAASGSNNDNCAQQGMLTILRANQLVDVTNKLISDANRCTAGSNFPAVQPLDKFGED